MHVPGRCQTTLLFRTSLHELVTLLVAHRALISLAKHLRWSRVQGVTVYFIYKEITPIISNQHSYLGLSKYACTHQKLNKNVEKCPMWSCKKKKLNEIQTFQIRLFFSEPIKLHLQFLYISKIATKDRQYQHSATPLPTTSASVQNPQQAPTNSAGPAQPRPSQY